MRMIVGNVNKVIVVLSIVLIAFSVLLITEGCGGGSGETANQNWKITAVSGTTLGAPHLGGTTCYPDVTFLVTSPDGKAAQGIDVFFYTGAFSGLAVGLNNCANANVDSVTGTTGNDGTVVISLQVTPAAVGNIFFIHASSGAAAPVQVVSEATVL